MADIIVNTHTQSSLLLLPLWLWVVCCKQLLVARLAELLPFYFILLSGPLTKNLKEWWRACLACFPLWVRCVFCSISTWSLRFEMRMQKSTWAELTEVDWGKIWGETGLTEEVAKRDCHPALCVKNVSMCNCWFITVIIGLGKQPI